MVAAPSPCVLKVNFDWALQGGLVVAGFVIRDSLRGLLWAWGWLVPCLSIAYIELITLSLSRSSLCGLPFSCSVIMAWGGLHDGVGLDFFIKLTNKCANLMILDLKGGKNLFLYFIHELISIKKRGISWSSRWEEGNQLAEWMADAAFQWTVEFWACSRQPASFV